MSRAATRTTAALLCGVVLVALGLAIAGLPDDERAPTSLDVAIDFEPFVAGVPQTRTSPVDVPVPSRVAEARVDTVGTDATIDVDLALCSSGDCRPLTLGTEIDPGPHTLTITAMLENEPGPGTSGDLVGLVRIVETAEPATIDTTLLITVAGGGLLAVAVGGLLIGQRREVER